MEYPPSGSEFLPQDISSWPLLPPATPLPTYEHSAVERSSSAASYSQWLPLPSHDQGSYLPGLVVQAHGDTTAHYSNRLAAGQTSLSLDPNVNNMVAQSQQLPIFDGTADVQPMAPPPNTRKRKAPTLRVDDWEPVKSRVIELHITQKLPLPEAKKMVEEEFKSIGFTAT
jgi:hypothetical protein